LVSHAEISIVPKHRITTKPGSEHHEQRLPPAKTPEIIGEAPAMQEVFRAIARLARSHITVLINGESGSGR
jgi:two-component system nitrogen regulation response regulator GlnG